jgi:hypothetical protein
MPKPQPCIQDMYGARHYSAPPPMTACCDVCRVHAGAAGDGGHGAAQVRARAAGEEAPGPHQLGPLRRPRPAAPRGAAGGSLRQDLQDLRQACLAVSLCRLTLHLWLHVTALMLLQRTQSATARAPPNRGEMSRDRMQQVGGSAAVHAVCPVKYLSRSSRRRSSASVWSFLADEMMCLMYWRS